MANFHHKRKPVFFWQGVCILLPVAVLAVLGLFSLRQDRRLAEQEAREIGAAAARGLAREMGDEMARALAGYCSANFDLHNLQAANLGLVKWAGGSNSEAAALDRIKAWQTANPGFDLTARPKANCSLNVPVEMSYPRLYPALPCPPQWELELSLEQRCLWQEAEKTELTSGGAAAVQAAWGKFLDSSPPAGACANAEFQLLLPSTRGLPWDEAAARFAGSRLARSEQLTGAGLPIGQMVCFQALRLLPTHAGLPPALAAGVAWTLQFNASVLSPRLISEAERVAGMSPEEAQKIAALKACWNADERARAVLGDFLALHPPGSWTNGLFWSASDGQQFLLALTMGTPARLAIFPESMVALALSGALAKADGPLPKYAKASLELGGKEMLLRQDRVSEKDHVQVGIPVFQNSPAPPLLGEASGALSGSLYPFAANAFPLRVRVFLADRDALYARQRQRTLLFGAMILTAVLAAVAGLALARRAFFQQLRLNELKSNFVSSVSHELRAPIASVRLLAENLERGRIPEPRRQGEYFHFIVQECRRLSALIENVLDFSRIEQGCKEYEFEPSDVTALARTTVQLMEPYAAEKGVKLETYGLEPGAPPIELSVDGRALQQALVNLIDNAIKHSPSDETVTVGLERKNGPTKAVHLYVADHGPGIPKEEHEKIFERFYRCGSELRRQTQGVGIGLSVVQHVVAAHGGRVVVQSEPGHGSRFTIELPERSQHA